MYFSKVLGSEWFLFSCCIVLLEKRLICDERARVPWTDIQLHSTGSFKVKWNWKTFVCSTMIIITKGRNIFQSWNRPPCPPYNDKEKVNVHSAASMWSMNIIKVKATKLWIIFCRWKFICSDDLFVEYTLLDKIDVKEKNRNLLHKESCTDLRYQKIHPHFGRFRACFEMSTIRTQPS